MTNAATTRPWTRAALAAVAASLLAIASIDRARAHGDEDHGGSKPPATTQDPNAVLVPIETQFLIGLRTERSRRGALAPASGLSGRTVAPPTGELRVTAAFAGRLFPPTGGFARLGETIEKGRLLGTLRPTIGGSDTAQIGLARTEASSRQASADARLDLARSELERLSKLAGVVAEREIQAAQAAIEIARAESARARADVGALAGGIGTQVLRSTLDGTIVAAHASPGEQIQEGAEIWQIVDLSKLWVDVRIPEADAARAIGERAEIALVADPTVRMQARRLAVASLVDPATRTVQALFEVDNPDRRLRVGALVDVAVAGGAAIDTVVVPARALRDRNGQPTVVVKTGPETFQVRPVVVGPKAAGAVGLSAGVRSGERVVIEGGTIVLLAAGG